MPENETYSNPLPPSSKIIYDDDDDAHPLTNDDFRKLMMTPKVPHYHGSSSASSGGATGNSSAATGASSGGSGFARPKPVAPENENDPSNLRRKKKSAYAALKKEEEAREKQLAEMYRDRAKERREGVNKDYETNTTAEPVSTTADYRAVAPDAPKIGEDYAEQRKKVIQESKYLGGDMEHTHLVKGLDYALLEKVKAEITNKEHEEEQMESAVTKKPIEREPVDGAQEETMQFRTKLARNIYRTQFRTRLPERNDLFLPGRMAYVVDLEDTDNDLDVPTTLIRSKADCPSLESTTTMTNNDIVINKLTQILSYLHQGGKRDRKQRKKDKTGKVANVADEKLKMVPTDIYGGLLPDYSTSARGNKMGGQDKERHRDRQRGSDRDHDHEGRDRRHERGAESTKRSYFEKPAEEDEERGGHDTDLPSNAKDLVNSINSRFAGSAGGMGGWDGDEEEGGGGTTKPSKEDERLKRLKSKNEIDSYAECYPGMAESADAIDDSDDEADYTKMDQGNKKGPVGRWDFDTQEEYSNYMSAKEALPKAAFQYGVKMSDGRKTRRAGVKDEKKELDKEWQKIQNIISKRKGGPSDSEPSAKRH